MMIRLAAAFAVLLLGLSACTPTGNSVTTNATGAGTSRLSFGTSVDIANVGARVSTLRAQNGVVRPVGHSAALQAVAQAHADTMARTGEFSHSGANGSTLATRMRASGYTACFAAENIAHGQTNIAQVFQDWMSSDGHRRNILSPQATQFGFARNGTYSVLVLGRSC
ncbi:CAP domain-containing protein [Hasllibacter sp. MH4015]|uniref:CAP domain-containing protein n=1 Tax=Hasllibacter sp. MH4015 TaxID=2854029 RepID=UPI001CD491C7|nr:CAP domain-containing protein [Hasllibacter sp. MH4015]